MTVVAADCSYADAMATALIVLGPANGRAFAITHNIAAHFIVPEGDVGLREFATPAFAALSGRLVAGRPPRCAG